MLGVRRIQEYPLQLLPAVVKAAGTTPVMFDSGVRDATDVIIALALGATDVGIGRPYAYALSYGGAESLTHFLRAFLAELDLCLAVCVVRTSPPCGKLVANRPSTKSL
jgi:isopentenyl diphosphate isomerase/L-lactate dehydrogenase-like FMN-dependent dehydrogenase